MINTIYLVFKAFFAEINKNITPSLAAKKSNEFDCRVCKTPKNPDPDFELSIFLGSTL